MNRVDQLISDLEKRCEAIAEALRERGYHARVIGTRETQVDDPNDMGKLFQLEITDLGNITHTISFPYPSEQSVILPWERYFEPIVTSKIPEYEQFIIWIAIHFQSMGLLILSDENKNTLPVRDALGFNHKITL